MHVSGISAGSYQAVGAGLRAQMKAQTMQTVLAETGMLDPNLAAGLSAIQREGEAITAAGLEAARLDVVGTLIDALA